MTINAASIGQAYKKQPELGLKVNKAFMVPVEHIYLDVEQNVRDLDWEHINSLAASFDQRSPIKALIVQTTKDGFMVVDGQHTFEAAKIAGALRLECKEFAGTEAEKIAFMVASSQGKPLDPIQRAKAYRRMTSLGMTKDEISKSVGRSRADIDNHLILLDGGDAVIDAIKNGEISATDARHEIKKSGNNAGENIKKEIQKAKETGVKAKMKKFTKKNYDEAMEIICGMDKSGISERLHELVELYMQDK